MAQPTKAQIDKLEFEHKDQFIKLAQAMVLLFKMAKGVQDGTVKKSVFDDYYYVVKNTSDSWIKRQRLLETYGVPKVFTLTFLNEASMPYIIDLAKKYNMELYGTQLKGVGFIPILIWAVAILGSAITAYFITDEITDTAQEKTELINATANACQKMNLTPQQCQELIKQGVDSTSTSGIWGLLKPLVFVAGGVLVATNWDKIQNALFPKRKAA